MSERMPDAAPGRESIAIVCGGGSFPGAIADAVTRSGRRAVMFAVRGWADPAVVERYAHHWIALGQVGRFFRLARAEGCRDMLFIGTLLRPPLTQLRLDWQTIRLMPRLVPWFRGGDNRLLSGIASLAEDGGLRVIGAQDVAPDILAPEGVLGGCTPSARDRADIARALALIAAMGPFDIGQAAIVANNNIIAVEAAEGTDNLLTRVVELRRLGRVTTPLGVGVLVKAPKPGQDRRFDLPTIGPRTIENAVRAGLAGVAIVAGSTMVAEPEKVIAAADKTGVFVVAVREDTPR